MTFRSLATTDIRIQYIKYFDHARCSFSIKKNGCYGTRLRHFIGTLRILRFFVRVYRHFVQGYGTFAPDGPVLQTSYEFSRGTLGAVSAICLIVAIL